MKNLFKVLGLASFAILLAIGVSFASESSSNQDISLEQLASVVDGATLVSTVDVESDKCGTGKCGTSEKEGKGEKKESEKKESEKSEKSEKSESSKESEKAEKSEKCGAGKCG